MGIKEIFSNLKTWLGISPHVLFSITGYAEKNSVKTFHSLVFENIPEEVSEFKILIIEWCMNPITIAFIVRRYLTAPR